jgi:hypothetical protein
MADEFWTTVARRTFNYMREVHPVDDLPTWDDLDDEDREKFTVMIVQGLRFATMLEREENPPLRERPKPRGFATFRNPDPGGGTAMAVAS